MAVERFVARALFALPPRLQVRLSGRPALQLDGDTLDPGTQLMLAVMERRQPVPMYELGPERARLERRYGAAISGGPPEPVGSVAELEIEGGDGMLAARHYAPAEHAESLPMLVFFHGGGFVFGDLDTHDALCRLLCRHAGVHVLAIDYRLAPEHPFPAAVEDAQAAFGWACANGERLGADSRRIAVGGDSAGGNLAAVVAQLAARAGGPQPAMQLLIYPATDLLERRRSHDLFGKGLFLTDDEMDWFQDMYLGSGREHSADPRASPLRAEDLSGLAPAVVATAAFDPLRDEGEEYARALRDAGTPVLLRRFPGMIHGFVNMGGMSRRCREGVIELAGATRAMLTGLPAGDRAAAGRPL
jgi:acetyl esterase